MSAEPQILHLVIFSLDESKLVAEYGAQDVSEVFSEMLGKIPGLLEIALMPKNITPWAGYVDATQGYTHVLVSKHANAEALKIYAEHPEHKVRQSRIIKCFAKPPIRIELNLANKL